MIFIINFMRKYGPKPLKNSHLVFTILHFVSEPICHQIKNPEECSSGDFLGEYSFKSNWTVEHVFFWQPFSSRRIRVHRIRTSGAAISRGTCTAQTLSQKPLLCVFWESAVYLARRSSNCFIYMVHSLRPAWCVGAGGGQKRAEWQKGYTTQLYSSRAGSRMLLAATWPLRDARLDRK